MLQTKNHLHITWSIELHHKEAFDAHIFQELHEIYYQDHLNYGWHTIFLVSIPKNKESSIFLLDMDAKTPNPIDAYTYWSEVVFQH